MITNYKEYITEKKSILSDTNIDISIYKEIFSYLKNSAPTYTLGQAKEIDIQDIEYNNLLHNILLIKFDNYYSIMYRYNGKYNYFNSNNRTTTKYITISQFLKFFNTYIYDVNKLKNVYFYLLPIVNIKEKENFKQIFYDKYQNILLKFLTKLKDDNLKYLKDFVNRSDDFQLYKKIINDVERLTNYIELTKEYRIYDAIDISTINIVDTFMNSKVKFYDLIKQILNDLSTYTQKRAINLIKKDVSNFKDYKHLIYDDKFKDEFKHLFSANDFDLI